MNTEYFIVNNTTQLQLSIGLDCFWTNRVELHAPVDKVIRVRESSRYYPKQSFEVIVTDKWAQPFAGDGWHEFTYWQLDLDGIASKEA